MCNYSPRLNTTEDKHMKKVVTIFSVLLLSILVACSDSDDTTSKEADDESVVETEEGSEEENTGEEEENTEKESIDEIPEVSEEAMNHAYDIINDYDMVKDSHIEVSEEDKKITLAIQVGAATNEDHAKDLGDNFVRALASGVAIYSEDDLESPSKDNLGELYDYYDLHVGVGTDADNFIVQGAKVTGSPKITW